MRVSIGTIEKWLQEDVPYFDLTTHLLQLDDQIAKMEFFSREKAILCGSEEVAAICQREEININKFTKSGTEIFPSETFFTIKGDFATLNKVGKVMQNLFEYSSGIATRTNRLVKLAKAVNPQINILTTRKVFPGTKEIAIKSILAGGAYPHRLGLSESILLFEQHIEFAGGLSNLAHKLEIMKANNCEKKIIIEVDNQADALTAAKLPIDGIQYDKFTPNQLAETILQIKSINNNIIHLAAGGINETNVTEYAATNCDGIVTTATYFGKPTDISARFIKC